MDDRQKQERQHGGAFNAFILGVVVGVALTLLLTTKKGRRILKTLTNEGMDKLSKWENVLYKTQSSMEEDNGITPEDDSVDVDEAMEGQDYKAASEMRDEPKPRPVSAEAVKHALKSDHNGEHKHSDVRRFFKGAKK